MKKKDNIFILFKKFKKEHSIIDMNLFYNIEIDDEKMILEGFVINLYQFFNPFDFKEYPTFYKGYFFNNRIIVILHKNII